MATFYRVGSETVDAYGATDLPAIFVISSERLDGVTEVRFSIQKIGDQLLYVSDNFLSPYNATLIRTEVLCFIREEGFPREVLNSNSISKQTKSGPRSQVVLSDNDIVIFNGEHCVLPQPDEYCEAVVAFVSSLSREAE